MTPTCGRTSSSCEAHKRLIHMCDRIQNGRTVHVDLCGRGRPSQSIDYVGRPYRRLTASARLDRAGMSLALRVPYDRDRQRLARGRPAEQTVAKTCRVVPLANLP